MEPYDPVQRYLDRLRSMNPSTKLLKDIAEVEQQHQADLAAPPKRNRLHPGFGETATP